VKEGPTSVRDLGSTCRVSGVERSIEKCVDPILAFETMVDIERVKHLAMERGQAVPLNLRSARAWILGTR
jgi:hypothetical protein